MPTTINSARANRQVTAWRGMALCWCWLVLVTACARGLEPSVSWLRIEPTRALYTPGDTVELTVRNVGNVRLSYATCGSTLEEFNRGDWQLVAVPSSNCGDVGTLLDVGESRDSFAGVLPASVPAGTYRYAIHDAHLDQGSGVLPAESLVSAAFLVQR